MIFAEVLSRNLQARNRRGAPACAPFYVGGHMGPPLQENCRLIATWDKLFSWQDSYCSGLVKIRYEYLSDLDDYIGIPGRKDCLGFLILLILSQPAVGETSQQCPDDRGHPEEPQLLQSPTSHKKCRTSAAGGIHRSVGNRDTDEVNEG